LAGFGGLLRLVKVVTVTRDNGGLTEDEIAEADRRYFPLTEPKSGRQA
jgi:hypothetical protein